MGIVLYHLFFVSNPRFSRDVTAAMLVYRTIAKNVFWEFDSIIMQNLSDILPLFCTPTWPSHHVSENQESQTVSGVVQGLSRELICKQTNANRRLNMYSFMEKFFFGGGSYKE